MAWGKGRWPYLVRTRHPKVVTAFTLTSQVGYRPADLAVGEWVRRHSPFGGFQHFVGDQFVDDSTIQVIPNPTPELLRKLEALSKAWARQNSELEAKREELDNTFRYKRPHPVDLVSYVRKDRQNAFTRFCLDNDKEDQRLIAERTAVVARLVEKYAAKESKVAVNSFRPKKYEDFEIVDEDNKVVGHIRVKPSGVLWAPANAKVWYGVLLKDFAAFMEEHGKKQVK